MVWQAAKGLENHKRPAAFFGVMDNFRRYQNPFSGVKGVLDDEIASLYQLGQTGRRGVQRMARRNPVRRVVGEFENLVRNPVPPFFL